MRPNLSASVLVLCMLCSCAHKQRGTPDNEPTLKTLAARTVTVEPDQTLAASPAQAIAAYQGFLALAPSAPQREEAMRRMGDLEMERTDVQSDNPQSTGVPDYAAAVAHYQALLKTYPQSPANDRVLYQLARAQEQGGSLEDALKTLDRLVRDYPATAYLEEAQFRRGELLFTAQAYRQAAGADSGATGSAGADPQGFGAILERAAQGAIDLGHRADAQAITATSGGGNLTEVTTALARAELALQSAVAIRDRIVQAYQDIMHIGI